MPHTTNTHTHVYMQTAQRNAYTVHSQLRTIYIFTISCNYSTNLHLNTSFIKHTNCNGRNSYHTFKELIALVELNVGIGFLFSFYFKELTSFEVFRCEKLNGENTFTTKLEFESEFI